MRVAFYRAIKGHWWDYLVSAATFSRYSHVELVTPDGKLFSSSPRDGGVRIADVNLQSGKWDLMTVPGRWLSHIRLWAEAQIGDKYDWWGCLTAALPIKRQSRNKWFCSEIVATVLNDTWRSMTDPPCAGIPVLVTPGRLFKLLWPHRTAFYPAKDLAWNAKLGKGWTDG